MDNVTANEINVTLFAIFLAGGFVLFVVSLLIRIKTDSKYEIRPVDLVLILIPVFVWLFMTGKITKFNIAGVEVEVAEAFLSATETPITFALPQAPERLVDDIMNTVERARKEGVDRIPHLIRQNTEALEFQLGFGGYWGPAVETYFDTLSKAGLLKYVIIYDRRGKLFGIYDTQPLLVHLRGQGAAGYQSFATALKRADRASEQELQELPGFVPVSEAVTPASTNRAALESMARLNRNFLPVVDTDQRFIGVVERSKITASLIIDVTKAMEGLRGKGQSK